MRPLAILNVFPIFLALAASSVAAPYVVLPGDTLTRIAGKALGSGDRWPELCEANASVLSNCDVLPIGSTIEIQTNVESAAMQEKIYQPDEVQEPEIDVKKEVVAGPFDLSSDGWVIEGVEATSQEDKETIGSSINLNRAGVYDSAAKTWLAGPTDYDVSTPEQTMRFTTTSAGAVRLYPLRGVDNKRWVFRTVLNLEAQTNYLFQWTVDKEGINYGVSDVIVARDGE